MKFFFLTLLLLIKSSWATGFEVTKKAVIRDENFNARIQEIKLLDLTSEDSYDGKYFKIVRGKSNDPIKFDDSTELQLKAATTYYHLMRARNYFANEMRSQYVATLPKIIIRLELTNVFNELGHFANDNLDPQFNNALSIPSGAGFPSHKVEPWDNEIWFRPSKDINIKDFQGGGDFVSIKSALTNFRNETHMMSLQRFITDILSGGGSRANLEKSMIRLVGTTILIEVIYQGSDKTADFFSRKIYHLDSALVPEIIYHEFSHVALSNFLELTHSTPVNEGLADYFAGKIAKSKNLATKIKEYNLFDGKKVRKKQMYQLAFERGEYANSDFVFGLLWNVGTLMETGNDGQFVYGMAKRLTTNDSIREGLIQASLDECKASCKNPVSDEIKLYELYNAKNL